MQDLNVVIAGSAGEGVQTVGDILAAAVSAQGYAVSTWQEYESRIRGGLNSYVVRVGEKPRNAPLEKADVLLALNRRAVDKYEKRLKPEGTLLFRETLEGRRMAVVDFLGIAEDEVGGKIYANTVALGALAAVLGMDLDGLKAVLGRVFGDKSDDVQQANQQAADKGYQAANKTCGDVCPWTLDGAGGSYLLMTANDAIPLGAAHAGCRFISAYPMTPSTGIITTLARERDRLGVFAEQAEDEIAAINMALGAWYAGARSMVSTSGGGFALMVEGLSLAAITETPIVIHLAQRPGPATGLPTRTEQGELLFALHAGHGEFPRAIFAPGTLEDGFYLTQKAFNLADRYQVPVFILTDQYFIDSYYNLPPFDLSGVAHLDSVIRMTANYERYAFTEGGVTPRGIPGYGNGFVVVDSDEHDEQGHITEDHDIRSRMVEKRLQKSDALVREAVLPEWIGPHDAETLVICWGSTVHLAAEAIAKTKGGKQAVLYFKQVYPLHPGSVDLIRKAKRLCIVENNATAQFAQILQSQFQTDIPVKILKYNGLPFTVEELAHKLDAATG